MNGWRLTPGLAGLLLAAVVGAAPAPEPPIGLAVRVATVPVLDGNVLEDPAWRDAPVLTGFRQTKPDEGQPATERTEVRIVYDDQAIYVGAVCFDRTPQVFRDCVSQLL